MKVNSIFINAPARLHFGFVDLNGNTGRRFGSLGMAIDGLDTCLEVNRSRFVEVTGSDVERAGRYARRLLDRLGLEGGLSIHVHSAIPPHCGLGSGTQMALAVGRAIAELFELDISMRDVAAMLGRGNRSGIGIGAFEQGGFIVDGGRRSGGPVPSVLFRVDFPENWKVLLIFDTDSCGLHGEKEHEAFQTLPEFPQETAGDLCRDLLMKTLPGLVEKQLDDFGSSINKLQRVVGDYFAPMQGARFTSSAVSTVLGWLEEQGIQALGQSSWGPTGFAVIDGETRAFDLLRKIKTEPDLPSLSYSVVSGRNHGVEVSVQNEASQTSLRWPEIEADALAASLNAG